MKNLKIMKREYKINDFYQSVILLTTGYQLLRLERENSKYSVFVFADPEEKATSTISDYWERKIKVEARSLIENINELKTRLYTNM